MHIVFSSTPRGIKCSGTKCGINRGKAEGGFTFFLEIVQVAIFAIFVCDIFVFAISVTQPPPISPNFTKPTPANERPGFAGARARHTYRKTVG